MSHLVAFIGNDSEHVACALFQTRSALYWNNPTRPDGWGLGFVQGGDVLLQKRPRPESREVDFYALARDLRADAFVGRVGHTDDVPIAAENADPFRFRSWLFGLVGSIRGFEPVRDQLLKSVPDFLRRNIRGQSASEHLFHLFLAFLHDAGILESHYPDAGVVQRALHESALSLDRALAGVGAPPGKIALVATNGRTLVAESRSHPIHYLDVVGIADCTCPTCPDRQRINSDRRRITHESLRAVVIEANRDQRLRPSWAATAAGQTLIVGPDRAPFVRANT